MHLLAVWIAAAAVALSVIVPAHAQGLTVTALTVDGQPAQSVAGVQVRVPSAKAAQSQTLNAKDVIASGTEITLPRGARVELTSSNGNRITIYPGARFMAGTVSGKGESHQPLAGRIDFDIRKALDFFNIQYERITAAVKGTAYSVEIDPAKSLTISVTDGIVEVEREVHLRFAEAEADTTADNEDAEVAAAADDRSIRIAEAIAAGQSKTYRLNVVEYLAEFRNYGQAETYFRKSLADAEASRNNALIHEAVKNLMAIYSRISKPTAVLELEARCIELARLLTDRAREAVCWRRVGAAHGVLGEYRKALEYHNRELMINEQLYPGLDHKDTALSLSNLGVVYSLLKQTRRSIANHERALTMQERLYGDSDKPEIARSLTNLGLEYRVVREYRKALEYQERGLAMAERIFVGRDDPGLAFSIRQVGRTYERMGEPRKAIEFLEKALAMRERMYAGRDHPQIISALNALADAYGKAGDTAAAASYRQRAAEMRKRAPRRE